MNIHLLTDAQLVDKLKNKGSGASEEIFYRYFHILFLHSVRMLHHPDLAKQVVQQVFTTLLSDSEKIKSFTALDCYLYDCTRIAIMFLFLDGKVRPVEYYIKLSPDFQASEPVHWASREERDANLRKIFESEIPRLPPEVQDRYKNRLN